MLENDVTPYKRSIHRFFVRLFINLAEVDSIKRASESLGVYGHKGAHELARIHRSQKVANHVLP